MLNKRNNLFHHIDISCVAGNDWSGVGVAARRCDFLKFRRNTLHTSGGSEGVRPGRKSTSEYNEIYNTGHLQGDGALIQISPNAQSQSIVRYNWIHDSHKNGIRFDGSTGGSNGIMHHNVVWNVKRGLMVKGDLLKSVSITSS